MALSEVTLGDTRGDDPDNPDNPSLGASSPSPALPEAIPGPAGNSGILLPLPPCVLGQLPPESPQIPGIGSRGSQVGSGAAPAASWERPGARQGNVKNEIKNQEKGEGRGNKRERKE